MTGPRILQIAHNHPKFHPGGTEAMAMGLHRAALDRGFDSWFLGAVTADYRGHQPGAALSPVEGRPSEMLLWLGPMDWFHLSQPDLAFALADFAAFLTRLKPDVIHVHHLIHFGLEALLVARRVLPEARIVLTLHDYYLICAQDGQLFRPQTQKRCNGPDPDDCRRCRPERSAADFVRRRLAVKNAASVVDACISPSHFLKDIHERHGPFSRPIEVIENGYVGDAPAPTVTTPRRPGPLRFAYFGNITYTKGIGDLLTAATVLADRGIDDFEIRVNGAPFFDDPRLAGVFDAAETALGRRLVRAGRYDPADMPGLMAECDVVVFPSIWWENAPLVVNEAVWFGKPVLCYPHGGAREILERYGMGIFAARSTPAALGEAMEALIQSPPKPRAPIRTMPRLADTFERHLAVYGLNTGD